MISPIRQQPTRNWYYYHNYNHSPMMTRRNTRRNISRITHKNSYKGITMGYNPIHHLRNPILRIFLLSILSQKIIAHNRARVNLAPNGHSTIQSTTSTTTKYSHPTRLRSNRYMSTSQTTRKQRHSSNPRTIPHSITRSILHRTTGI